MKKHLKYLMLVGLVSFLALTACTAATAQSPNNDEYISLGEESQLAIAYVEVEFFYINGAGELVSTTLLTRGTAEDVFSTWAGLNGITDVVLMYSYTDSNCTTIEGEIATQRILGDEFILQITLSNDFVNYRRSTNGELLEQALMKTFFSYSPHLTGFQLSIDGYYGQEDFLGSDALEIFIDLMSNVNLGFNVLHEVNYNDAFEEIRGFRFDGEGERLVIWANQPIFNLSLVALEDDFITEEFGFIATDVAFSMDKLDSAAAHALVIDSYYGMGTMPRSGIVFEDMNGRWRYFMLQQSGYDGRFFLNEFEPWIVLESKNPNIAVIAGTVASMGPDLEWSGDTAADSGSGFYIQLDFVQRHCEYVDGLYVTSGVPDSTNIFIDNRNTLVLGSAKIEFGAVITVFYDDSNGRQVDALTATAIKPLDYTWVHVVYFDDNFLSTCGSFSLVVLDDAEITYKDGTPFTGEINDLTNRILAVYVTMSASPSPDAPLVHGIASSRVIILYNPST